jgi:hypothetical protein
MISRFKKWYNMAFRKNYKHHPKTTVNSNFTSVDLTPNRFNSNNTFMTPKCETKLAFTFNSVNKELLKTHSVKIINFSKVNKLVDPKENHDKEIILKNAPTYNSNNNLNSPPAKSASGSLNSSHSSTYPINQAEIGLREFIISNKTKFLERICKGPPDSFRWIAWIIASGIELERKEEFYFNLLVEKIDDKTETQIKKDLNRTSTDEKLFSLEMTKTSLFNVLRAYAICDKEVSYCQGMNFIAAFLLIVSDFNEVDTLHMMIFLFMFNKSNLGIRGFFMDNFPLLNLYTYQFNHLFEIHFPVLKKHFDKLEIPNELWIAKWFQTLFTICLPLDILIRLWDCILVKGLDFLFNFVLSFIKVLEKDLTKFEDIADISEYFKRINPYANNMDMTNTIFELDVEAIIKDALNIKISKNLLNKLKLEYEDKFKIDLSYIKVSYDLKSLYSSTNSNKDHIELENEINNSSTKSLPQIKFEFKSKFQMKSKDIIQEKEEELKKTDSDNIDKILTSKIIDNIDILNEENCSEFNIFEVDVINNKMMNTLNTKFLEDDKKKKD